MPLDQQNVPIPLAQGVDTKTDSKQVQLGKLLTLENGFFQTPGEIRKRPGFDAKARTVIQSSTPLPSIDAANGLYSYADQLLLASPSHATTDSIGRSLFSRDQGNSAWKNVGYFQPALLTTGPVTTINLLDSLFGGVSHILISLAFMWCSSTQPQEIRLPPPNTPLAAR